MYGFITALEFRVSESDLAAAIGARSEGVDEELTDLADVRREVAEDSFHVSSDEKGNMTVSRVVHESVTMDLETLETHYRLSYLANDFDTGDVDPPSLCYMQKYQEYRPAANNEVEGHYRFVYVAEDSTLEFVKMSEHRAAMAVEGRDRELAQANRMVDSLQGQADQLTTELAQSQGFLEIANAALQLLREENEALRTEIADKDRVITDAGESINRAAAEIMETKNSNGYLNQRLSTTESDIALLREQNTGLRNQIADLAPIHDERDVLRRRVFQLEAAGERISRVLERVRSEPGDEPSVTYSDAADEIGDIISEAQAHEG